MNINRHNYETFFLLYVDKELSAADRKAVEVFVQENPDLQIELALLQQTVLPVADDIVLHKKDWLYMEEDISSLQENLLLYADDELNTADREAVELLLQTHAPANKEWDILRQTKLEPDMAVAFPDKQSLYRKEPGRVVGFAWWRVAAAAVILGFGFWTGVSVYKNNVQNINSARDVVKENKVQTGQQKTIPVMDEKQPENIVENTGTENNTATTISQQTNSKANSNDVNAADKTGNRNIRVSVPDNQSTASQSSIKPDNNLPQPYFENINNGSSNKTVAGNVQPENNNSTRVSGNNDAVVKINPKENKALTPDADNSKTGTNAIAMQVVNTNTTAEDENNNRYLNLDNDKQKRSALGGLIRKAKRVLERTTNVKTGEGIKIAGFEIALK